MDEKNAVLAENKRLRAENTKLRAIIARSKVPCLYCGLTEMSKCERGFPGCGRMDDLMADEFEIDP